MKKLKITVFTIGLLFLLSISLLPQTVESNSNNNLTQINSNISGTVAIFKDYNAWGSNATEEIFESHLIPYVVYSSLDIGIVDISLFEKVIIESEQSLAFNNAVTNNRAYFESYVFNGGILEIHAATNSAWNNILPGGFLYVNEYPNSIEILDTNHPILNSPAVITDEELDNWGSSAHGTLQGQDPGDKNILAAESSTLYTKSVLLESFYGNGSFIVSSQTLEYGYYYGYSTILENILLYNPQSEIAIFRNGPGWSNANVDIINSYTSFSLTVFPETSIGTVDLSRFRKVIIESDQSLSFNNQILMNNAYFENYASNGGILEIHAGTNSEWNHTLYGSFPGGYQYVNLLPELDVNPALDLVNIVDPAHPFVNYPFPISDVELDNWNYAIHGYITNVDPPSRVVLNHNGDPSRPVLLEKYFGQGRIIISSQTLEHGYYSGSNSLILENIISFGMSKVNIVDTPLILSSPGDLNINQGDFVSLSWTFTNPQPDSYYIYLDNNLVTSGSWFDAAAITYNPIGLPLGEHEITIMVLNLNGKSTFHSIKIGVDDGFAPTLVSYNNVYNFEYGTQDNNVMWIYSDALPDFYEIYVDGFYYQWGEWTSDNPILFNMDYWEIGEYNVSIKVYDKRYIISESWSWVYIADTTSPDVSSPGDIEIEEGSFGMSIIWEVYDLNGGTWQVDLDNNLHSEGNFNEGLNEIVINLDGLLVGLHTFILNVFDYNGNYATDEVLVNVVEVSIPPASTTPPESTTPPASTTPPPSSSNPPPDGEESSSQPSLPIPFSSNLIIGFSLIFVTVSIRMKRRSS